MGLMILRPDFYTRLSATVLLTGLWGLSFGGYYTVAITGGTITYETGGAAFRDGHFASVDAETYLGYINVAAGDTGIVAGNLTATYTWHPAYTGEPTPAHVLVREYVYTYWQAGIDALGLVNDGQSAEVEKQVHTGPPLQDWSSYRATWKQVDSPGNSFQTTANSTYAEVDPDSTDDWGGFAEV